MKIKTSELTGAALDWAVATADGKQTKRYGVGLYYVCSADGVFRDAIGGSYRPSTEWSQGGPIIEQEGIGVLFDSGSACRKPGWFATHDYESEQFESAFMVDEAAGMHGPTPLVAAVRCYVASKLGDEVEVPNELA